MVGFEPPAVWRLLPWAAQDLTYTVLANRSQAENQKAGNTFQPSKSLLVLLYCAIVKTTEMCEGRVRTCFQVEQERIRHLDERQRER